jgi:hypothetical protein
MCERDEHVLNMTTWWETGDTYGEAASHVKESHYVTAVNWTLLSLSKMVGVRCAISGSAVKTRLNSADKDKRTGSSVPPPTASKQTSERNLRFEKTRD